MSRGGPGERTRGRDDYETPPWLFKLLQHEFDFDVDAAADQDNCLTEKFWYGPSGKHEDALAQPWSPWVQHFCNPPFGRMVPWVKHIVAQQSTTVLVAPLAPDRGWYKIGVRWATEVRQLTHRVEFLLDGEPVTDKQGRKVGNTIGTALFVFRRHAPDRGAAHVWMWDARAAARERGLI